MLHVEFVQSSNFAPAGGSLLLPFLAETRPVVKDNRREARVWLFALADPVAAGMAAETAAQAGPSGGSAIQILAQGFHAAPMHQPLGATVDQIMQDAAQFSGGKQALVVCALCFDRAVVAHNGDACCYLVRHNHATRLTLGNVQLIDYQIQPGDVLLLSGEPLQSVKGSEMAELAGRGVDLNEAAGKILDLVQQRGEHSRMSVVMIRVLAVERSSHGRALTPRARVQAG